MDENLLAWQIFNEVRFQKLTSGDLNLLAVFAVLDEYGLQGQDRQRIYAYIRMLYMMFQSGEVKKKVENKEKNQLDKFKGTVRGGQG